MNSLLRLLLKFQGQADKKETNIRVCHFFQSRKNTFDPRQAGHDED